MGELISSPTTHYEAQKFLGCGTYGLVIQCRDVTTNETVALKMFKRMKDVKNAKEEEDILRALKELHSEWFNIVRLIGSFTYERHYCLVFEHLDMDLQKFMEINPGQHLQLKQIRPILQQLATSLDFLKSAGFIHSDLKPENILMVDPVRQPLKVKLIDFGLACNNPGEQTGHTLQTLWYRSPEILQGVPFNEAIDVWSLGCIAAELFMGRPLFPALDETSLRRQIVFTKPLHERDFTPYWFWPKYWMESRFMIHQSWGEDVQAEYFDLECFIDLLAQMLMTNQSERIHPRRILQHPFITMSHLKGPFKNSLYMKSSEGLMDICQNQSSDDGAHVDHMVQRMSLNEDSSSSTAGPAMEGSPAGMRDENHSFLQNSIITRGKKRKLNAKLKEWQQTS
ncbi:homeodomain-interacting protein kinase 3-like isoform X2 [Hippoglossus hippoglossus]|uniref:homeodomain-interacting protein kinase 3-like isoform X2 n=1 Tax=Hippoglossus hippoglossus TaxID=8267 RepID=UPI00148C22AE|nr:homeodomain-interacting protein kinase 3-like isoform X2 [Hippoglossus hippoglossus]